LICFCCLLSCLHFRWSLFCRVYLPLIMSQKSSENPDGRSSPPAAKRQRVSPAASASAISSSNGEEPPETDIDDSQQQQEQEQPKAAHKPQHSEKLKTSTLYIGGLHPRVAKIHLEKLMQKFGTMHRLDVKITPTNQFAFCEYQSIAQAQAAMVALDGRMLLGKRLMVKPANAQSTNPTMQHAATSSTAGTTSSAPVNINREKQRVEDKIQQVRQKIEEAKAKMQD
jgi:RNA recognition motif-containing protein